MPLFTLQSKEVKLIFGEISAKYQAYIALLFGKNWLFLATFHSTIKMKSNWFLVKFRQNTKPIALHFGKNWPIFATFHSTIKRSQMDFWWNSAKYQAYSLTFWRKWANFCHFSLYNKMKSNGFLVKFRQNTKPIALLFGENGLIFATFHSTIKRSQIDFWSNFGKIPSL